MKKLYLLSILAFTTISIIYSCSTEEEDTTPPPSVVATPEPEPPAPTQYTLTVTAGEGGTVSTEGGTYDEGTEVTITATPDEGYIFIGWNELDTEELEVTLNLNSDKSLTAVFEKLNYTIEEYQFLLNTDISEGSYIENIARMFSFYNIPSTFTYKFNEKNYLLIAGDVCGAGECQDAETAFENVPPMSSILFGYEPASGWKFIKHFPEAKTWNIRNFEKKGNFIVMGDGNEIGPYPENWYGNAFIGEIVDDDILWNKINDDETMSYQHDISIGDVDGDNDLDVIVAPLNGVFVNNSGIFSLKDKLNYFDADGLDIGIDYGLDFNEEELLSNLGLSVQIDDLDNDGVNEIIFSDFYIYVFKKINDKYQVFWKGDSKLLYSEWELISPGTATPISSTMIEIDDFNNDGIKDMIISREYIPQETFADNSDDWHSFDVWIGNGDSTFTPQSVTKLSYDIIVREFSLMDVNNDGYKDVILKSNFGYFTYDRETTDSGYNFDIFTENPKGVILNELVYINQGNGNFVQYDEKKLYIDGIKPYQIIPYMRNDKLHFIGFSYDKLPTGYDSSVELIDGKVPIFFYDIEMEL